MMDIILGILQLVGLVIVMFLVMTLVAKCGMWWLNFTEKYRLEKEKDNEDDKH